MQHVDEYKRISKFLSMLLRHRPELIGITLDENGWTDVDTLLLKLADTDAPINFETLKEIVSTNQKKRFAFNEDLTMIRASQGHSVNINPGYNPEKPPAILYHGTGNKNELLIMEKGISKMGRLHVHLSTDIQTAFNVGQRHGKPVIFEVNAEEMHKQGHIFFRSDNGVWLTEEVPAGYFRKVIT